MPGLAPGIFLAAEACRRAKYGATVARISAEILSY